MPERKTAPGGFTLVELIIVLVVLAALASLALPRFVDFEDETRQAGVDAQAQALISNDTINRAACEVGNPGCVDITSRGNNACEDGMAAFLPQLDLDRWQVENIPSSTSRSEWVDHLEPGEALFWVTRFLGDDDSDHPDDDWFNDWSATQPCRLSRVD